MNFLKRFFGPTWTLVNVGVWMMITAVSLMLMGPSQLAGREEAHMETSVQVTASFIAGVLEDTSADSSHISINDLLGRVREVTELTYLILNDEHGHIIGSINEAGAIRLGYNRPKNVGTNFSKTGLVQATRTVALTDSTTGNLYLGISDPAFFRTHREFQIKARLFGTLLLLFSGGIFVALRTINRMESRVYALRKAQKDLSQQKGNLESKVNQQQKIEAELKESEQRYRYLLENAMESAFSDLEALNKNLERQKAELEVEVEQKTLVQASLARYADRLSSLNAIERLLVSEVSLDEIVQKSLQQIKKLIDCKYATILNVDTKSEEVQVLGSCGSVSNADELAASFELKGMRREGDAWMYIQDLRDLSDRTKVEEALVQQGFNSYGRATLSIGDTLVGALIVCGEEVDAFDASDITAIRDIADLISLGLSQQKHRVDQERYELELITERDRAEEMARLKSAFLANMSHEIRTPLSGIIGFGQVLHEEVPEPLQEFTGLIQDAAKRLLNTINSVLDLSKLEANTTPAEFELLDFSSQVEERLVLLSPLAQNKGITMNVHAAPGIFCRIDRGALDGIVNNLVGNAIKFTNHGSVTTRVVREGAEVCLEVKDSGVGISKKFMPYLFDEFRQEHMGSDRPHEGTGLGLAIAHKLVVRMNGRIEVESEINQGTTFRVYFPCAEKKRSTRSPNAKGASRSATVHQGPSLPSVTD